MRHRTHSGQAFELLGPPQAKLVWIMAHGWTDRKRFIADCGLHLPGYGHQAVAYPLASRWLWRYLPADRIADVAYQAADMVGAEKLVVGGHSRGCNRIHEAADECGAACLVHWGGLWPSERVAACPGVFLYGSSDPFGPVRKETQAAAKAYGAEAEEVAGAKHRWLRAKNEWVIGRVGELIGGS